MIGIIDYGLGNLRSVQKAFEHVGTGAKILGDPGDVDVIDKLILPGVGAFADGMEHLGKRGWVEPIRSFIDSGRPLMGICLGLQFLFDGSEEDAPTDCDLVSGLGVLGGSVIRFRQSADAQTRLKVPHMGWNTLHWERADPLYRGLEQGCAVYFVHSYYAVPADAQAISARTDYGGPVCASVWRDNVYATQFHPEKSQRVGLTILKNFAEL